MNRAILLKHTEGLELWTSISETTQHFAVKVSQKRARVLTTLAEAEAYFATALSRIRASRAH